MSYDQKCYDLAEAFLSDIQKPVNFGDADALAQAIQTTIEDYLNEVEERAAEPPPAIKLEIERDMNTAIRQGKIWGEVYDQLFFGKKVPR